MTEEIPEESPNFVIDPEISNEVIQESNETNKIRQSRVAFHKNNSFPQFHANNDPFRKNPIILETALPIISKRPLSLTKVTDAKRFRVFLESSGIDGILNLTSESVTAKEPSLLSSDIDDSYLRMSIDEKCQSTSSNSTQEFSESTESDNSNSLHGQFFQSLRLGKLYRASPTNSTSSLPVPHNASGWSPRDDDAKSCVSDSATVQLCRSSKCLPGESVIQPEGGLAIQPEHDESQYLDIEDDDSMKEETSYESDGDGLQFRSIASNLDENNDWFESTKERASPALEEKVLKLPHTQSSGILPAIPSHKTRERSYLVGRLTKHASLLGVEELNRYFPDKMLKIFIGTWNMQKTAVPKNLDDFILPKHKEFLQDIYVIGVQESTIDQKMWEIKLQETLGVNHVLIRSVSHGVLHLSVFVRRDLIWFCSSVEDDKVTTRMVSQVKTKGAVAIAFQFFGTSLLFVNAHFHSGQSKVKERIEDFNKIKEKLKLPRTDKVDGYKRSDVTSRYDCVFWFGDLNFRVNLPPSIMRDEIHASGTLNLKEALKWDQLHATIKRKLAFHEFHEPRIKFRPTYKFLPDSESYAVSSKPRTPSYTDRILYKSRPKEDNSIYCSDYDSVSSLKHSDHRPVYGFFEVSLKPGRENASVGSCNFRSDVYEKAARLRAHGTDYQNNSSVCNIL